MTPRYEPHEIEPKWQRVWEDERAFNVPNPVPGEPTAENHWYQLEMLPYPSGPASTWATSSTTRWATSRRTSGGAAAGTSCGRWAGTPSGCRPRTRRSARAAIRARSIERNIETMRAQMKRLGWAIDWEREVSAHEPTFYRWTQWLFLQFVEHGLGYRKEAPVNWCPNDQTVIANEYVVDGRCERCGAEVELRNMTQWFFRTTAYADELLEYLRATDWPERTKTIQRNWIGRSEGAEILFRVDELGEDVAVFTTRPDTLFGATFFVLAPEHPFVDGARERRGEGVRAARRRAPGRGARGGEGEDRRLHRAATRRTRSTASSCRSGSPTTS